MGARSAEYWPELLEHVVWSQHPWVLKLGMAPVAEQSSKTHQPLAPLKIYIDLCLKKRTLDNFLTYLLRWMDQRKASHSPLL